MAHRVAQSTWPPGMPCERLGVWDGEEAVEEAADHGRGGIVAQVVETRPAEPERRLLVAARRLRAGGARAGRT